MATKEKNTTVKKAANAQGIKFTLVHHVNMFGDDTGYEVWGESRNYRNGETISHWVTCKRGMTLSEATEYFGKRIGN
jgi:hypothetical protein